MDYEPKGVSKLVEAGHFHSQYSWCVNLSCHKSSHIDHKHTATSVAVERTFSRGRILIPHLRNRLRAVTIQALMCFGDWSREDFVTNLELVDFLDDKSSPPIDDEPDIIDVDGDDDI